MAACEGIEDEDLHLYKTLLQQWADSNPDADPKLKSMVGAVYGLAAGGSLQPLDLRLMLSTVRHLEFGTLPGEHELLEELGPTLFEPQSLERYADFLESQGYAALARRTRGLANR